MKREIKFRAIVSGKMGDPFNPFDSEFLSSGGTFPEGTIFIQYTGLKDKNGTEIYEGDIVNYSVKKRFCKNENCDNQLEQGISKYCSTCGTPIKDEDFITTAKVVYDKAAFGYRKENANDTYQQWPVYANEIYIAWVEVIGNIYSDPKQKGNRT